MVAVLMSLTLAGGMCGCVSSKVRLVDLNLKPQRDTVIEVMPYAAAEKQYTTSDAGRRGLLGLVIDANTGIYTYKVDARDYANLRESIIQSLRKSDAFKDVRDIQNESESRTGVCLFLKINESGMRQTAFTFVCVIKGKAWTSDASGRIITQKDINVEQSSAFTVGAAKSKAISKCVQEVVAIFASGDTSTPK